MSTIHQMAMSGKNHSPLREEFVLQPQDGISPLFARTLDSLTLISFVSPACIFIWFSTQSLRSHHASLKVIILFFFLDKVVASDHVAFIMVVASPLNCRGRGAGGNTCL